MAPRDDVAWYCPERLPPVPVREQDGGCDLICRYGLRRRRLVRAPTQDFFCRCLEGLTASSIPALYEASDRNTRIGQWTLSREPGGSCVRWCGMTPGSRGPRPMRAKAWAALSSALVAW